MNGREVDPTVVVAALLVACAVIGVPLILALALWLAYG